jgi:hypothetical protein
MSSRATSQSLHVLASTAHMDIGMLKPSFVSDSLASRLGLKAATIIYTCRQYQDGSRSLGRSIHLSFLGV